MSLNIGNYFVENRSRRFSTITLHSAFCTYLYPQNLFNFIKRININTCIFFFYG